MAVLSSSVDLNRYEMPHPHTRGGPVDSHNGPDRGSAGGARGGNAAEDLLSGNRESRAEDHDRMRSKEHEVELP